MFEAGQVVRLLDVIASVWRVNLGDADLVPWYLVERLYTRLRKSGVVKYEYSHRSRCTYSATMTVRDPAGLEELGARFRAEHVMVEILSMP